ncbi:Transmembrane protein 53 [Anthophora quadrimaculata]
MMVGRVLSTLARARFISYPKPQLLNKKQNLTLSLLMCKLSSYHVTKNIEHISQGKQVTACNTEESRPRPLLVLFSWLLAKRKYLMKYMDLYLEQNFDILIVSVTPWQMLWPVKGSRLVAADLLEFLTQQQNYQQILLHGFSVGGYMWGEVLDLVQSNHQKYCNVIDRIVGQVWDSLVYVTGIPLGIPRAVFPKNEMLQRILQKYLEYHLKTFYKQSTQYYVQSSHMFHRNLVRTPALFLVSKTDPVGAIIHNMRVRDQWDTLGVKTYVKIFEKSPHVGHYPMYPKEYVLELYTFLNKLSLVPNEEKMKAHI